MNRNVVDAAGRESARGAGDFGQRRLRGLRRVVAMLRGAVKRWGPPQLKRWAWDLEYGAGSWDHHADYECAELPTTILRYLHGGRLLDLGCGDGVVGQCLPVEDYESYTGVDISEVALARAFERDRALCPEKAAKNHYVTADIADFQPDTPQQVILFRYSLNYVPRPRVLEVLRHYQQWLSPDGVLVVIQNAPDRHAYMLEVVREHFEVLEDRVEVNTLTLVFR